MKNNVLDDMEIIRVRALIEEGRASGICEEEPEDVIKRIIAERRTKHTERTTK